MIFMCEIGWFTRPHSLTRFPFQHLKTYLRFAMSAVSAPAARLNLIGIKAPEFEFFLEQRSADIGRIVQLPRPVVVQYLREDSGVPVEEVLIQDGIVVGEGLRQAGQSRRSDFLQGSFVRLVTYAAHVEDDSVFAVHSARDESVNSLSAMNEVRNKKAITDSRRRT